MAPVQDADLAPDAGHGDDTGWFHDREEAGVAKIELDDARAKQLTYAVDDGMALFEGDIALGPADLVAARQQSGALLPMGIGITGNRFRWPNGVVPYEIHPALPAKERVTQAIEHWRQKTRLRFVERTGANMTQYQDYIIFKAGNGCWSYVGRQGGGQMISVGSGCNLGSVIHEIGHAIGLWHEQSREDRERHVRILWQNIDPRQHHNFTQHILDGDDLGRYNYGSIMHYPRKAFSRNGQDTIVPLNGASIGQRVGLNDEDCAAVRALYPALYT